VNSFKLQLETGINQVLSHYIILYTNWIRLCVNGIETAQGLNVD